MVGSPARDTLTVVFLQMTEESCRPHVPTQHMTQGKQTRASHWITGRKKREKTATICCHFHPRSPFSYVLYLCQRRFSYTLQLTTTVNYARACVFACAATARLLFCRPRAALFSSLRVLRQWCSWPASEISSPFARLEHQKIQIGNKRDSKFDSSIMLFAPHSHLHSIILPMSVLLPLFLGGILRDWLCLVLT